MTKKTDKNVDLERSTGLKKILKHPDRSEIINKLVIDISVEDIHSWLATKYSNVNEATFVISKVTLKNFKDDYLDIYSTIKAELQNTSTAIATNTVDDLKLAVSSNTTYREKLLSAMNTELDLRNSIKTIALVLEERLGTISDQIQENSTNINPKLDRLFLEYVEKFGDILEKLWKFTEAPAANNTTNYNISYQVVDKHIISIQEAIKKILSEMDLENSMYFMELFNDEMSKLQMSLPTSPPLMSQEIKASEIEIINDQIHKKLND